jgi:hypothetical protein
MMMKSFLLSLVAITVFATSVQAQDPASSPVAYMNAIENAQKDMDQKYMAYMSAAAHGRRARKLEKMRKQVLESITNSRYAIINLPFYKGDNTLRQSSIDYVALCYNVFNDDYNKIVNTEEIAEQSFDGMQAFILLQEKTNEKIKEASNKIHDAEKVFAAKYNVNLVEGSSELGEKMAIAGKLNHYRNQLYLIFFKCNWQDGQMIDAMNKKKVNDVEQSRGSIIRYADEGILALDSLKFFMGDATLGNACKEMLKYYKRMAENDVPKLTDYFLKQENFEKIKKAFDAKPSSSRTREDVDAFNKAVGEMNAGVKTYNDTNNKINKERSQAINEWEKTEKEFADKHMPRYR